MSRKAWVNGNIITLDGSRPRAEAIVAEGELIAFVGGSAEARALAEERAGGKAEVVDLGGRTVVPGFNDNHVHAVHMGDHALAPDLGGLDAQAIVRRLREAYPSPARGEILRAFNWDYPACPEPRKELLDEAFPSNPVALSQYSGHAYWMNSAALRAVGIGRGLPEPVEGTVLRDPNGEPTGVVRDLGDTVLSRRRNRAIYYDPAQRGARMEIALSAFARLGICSVQDNAWFWPELLELRSRLARGTLTARFSCWPLGRNPRSRRAMDAAFALGLGARDWIRPGPIKFFLDGTFSTRNACLFEPFLDSPGGCLCSDPAAPLRELEFLALRRRQGAFHIIGDKGVSIFLDAYEEALARHPGLSELRVRIEHAQLIRPSDIERIARLGILVCAQPSALNNPGKDLAILGRDRALRAYPYRSLLDAGVHLSFGSDIPGESDCDPLRSIHMAVNREGPERVGVLEALDCYTRGGAYAEFAEARKGSLVPGMLADFAVLSRDIASVPLETIGDTRVEETVVGGRSVFSRERFDSQADKR
jgi:predicted amidohydrolase YtcJ